MKKKKLKLDQIKVSSFVTESDKLRAGAAIDTGSSDFFKTREAICDANTKVFCSKDVMCDIRYTFMHPNTGGCKHSDIGICPTDICL
ncbi:MAG: pinensin family lanthipeptide [Bacteroidota bacterium]